MPFAGEFKTSHELRTAALTASAPPPT